MGKYKKKYHRLKDQYDELYDYIHDIQGDNKLLSDENRYLNAFIEWKNLSDDFIYFKEHAVEVFDEDLPFPRLTL